MTVVANARKRVPFTVVDMQPSDFIDLTAMSSQLTNRKKAVDGSIVSWLNIQSIRFTSDSPQVMNFKSVCDPEAPWLSVDLKKRIRQKEQIQLVHSACEKRSLNRLKVNDLQSLKPFIPPIYHAFYDTLLPDTADDETLEMEDDMLINSEDELVDTHSVYHSSHSIEESDKLPVVSPVSLQTSERSVSRKGSKRHSSKLFGGMDEQQCKKKTSHWFFYIDTRWHKIGLQED